MTVMRRITVAIKAVKMMPLRAMRMSRRTVDVETATTTTTTARGNADSSKKGTSWRGAWRTT